MNLVQDLFSGLRSDTPKAARPSTLQEFLETDVMTETGPWTLEGHEPFGEIVSRIDQAITRKETDTEISILAGEQVGKTMIAIGLALHLVVDRGRNVGYFLPTDNFAHKFGRTRLKRLIAKSPYLSARLKDSDAVNQATVKEFDGKFLYILGLESMLGAISIPLDVLIYDEVDLLPEENYRWSQGRVAHSDLRVKVSVSAGYTPGAGIDSRFQEGTQHKFLIHCGCGNVFAIEEEFPRSIARIRKHWARICPACSAEVQLSQGRWIPTFPDRAKKRKYSYRVPSLIIGARALDHTMKRYEDAKKKKSDMAKFDCSDRAIPNAGAMQPIGDAELTRMQSKLCKLTLVRSDRPRYAGMDTGDLCHFVTYERSAAGQMQLVWIEEIDSDVADERAVELCFQLGVVKYVVDSKPLRNLARAIVYRLGNAGSVQDFAEALEIQEVELVHEGKPYRGVKVNRDDSLDAMTSEATSLTRGLVIPDLESDPRMPLFATHLKNLRKEREIDPKGRAVDKYVKKVANHYGMALNSARVAELIAPRLMPFEYTPAGGRRDVGRRMRRALLGG